MIMLLLWVDRFGTRHLSTFISSDIYVEGNVIIDPIGSGIFFGVDGEAFTEPFIETRNVHVSRNIITGDWEGSCIIGTLPALAEKIHVVNNICTKTGDAGDFTTGISIRRVGGIATNIPPARDILVGFNTIVGDAGGNLSLSGIFISGPLKDIRVIGNEVRDVGNAAIILRFREILNTVVSNNLVSGQIQLGQFGLVDNFNFNGVIQSNSILDSGNFGIALLAQSEDIIIASVRDNVIKNSTKECVSFTGAGTYLVDLVDNEFTDCGGVAEVSFLDGATLAPGSVNIGNIER